MDRLRVTGAARVVSAIALAVAALVALVVLTGSPASAADEPAGTYQGTVTLVAVEPTPYDTNTKPGASNPDTYVVECSGGTCTVRGTFFAGGAPGTLTGGGGTWTGEIADPGADCPFAPRSVTMTGDAATITLRFVQPRQMDVACASGGTAYNSGTTYEFVGTQVAPPTTTTAVPTTTSASAKGGSGSSSSGSSSSGSSAGPTAASLSGHAKGLNSYQRASIVAVERGRRSTVPAALTRPSDAFDGGLRRLVENALIAGLIVLLLVFPSQLFNNTYSANQDRVDAGLRRVMPWRSRAGTAAHPPSERSSEVAEPPAPVEPPVTSVGRRVGRGILVFALVATAGAVLGQFLDPNVKADAKTFALFVGILVSIAVDKALEAGVGGVFRGARHQSRDGFMKSAPLGLLIAAGCVVVSRATHFQPGYLYGLIGGWAFARAMTDDDEGRLQLVATFAALGVALVAWVVFVPVADAANKASPNFAVLVLDSLLAAMFIGGIEGLLFGLTPLRFMPGHTLSKWNWWAWGIAAMVVAFTFVQVLLRPSSGYLGHSTRSSVVVTCVLFALFGLTSVLFWAWFRTHPSEAEPEAPDLPDTPEVDVPPDAGPLIAPT